MSTVGRWLRYVVLLAAVTAGVALAQTAPAPEPATTPAGPAVSAATAARIPASAPLAPLAVPAPSIVGNDAFAAGKPLVATEQKAAIIRLNAPVDDMMLKSINRRLDLARKAGCTLIIFEVDTYGGLVTSALEISTLIKKLPSEHLTTVAWVHDKAFSAGSLISAACQVIVMAPESSIGDCAPIMLDNSDRLIPMQSAERSKAVSPILSDFRDSAEKNHLNPALLEAMVVPEVEIHEMQNNLTGEVRYVDTPGKDALLKEENVGPGGQKQRPWSYVQTVDNNIQLLTVKPELALKMGLSKATIATQDQLRGPFRIQGDILVLDFNWAEIATVFLTQGWVRFFLFVGMLVFAWIEFAHPGVSIPGILAVVCLILLVGAPFLTGLAQVWEIALIVVGVGIIAADFFAFGGVGMLAIPGFILMAIGLVASFVPAAPGGGFASNITTWKALQAGLGVLVGGSFMALAAFFMLSRYLYLTPGFNRLQLAPAGGKRPMPAAALRDAADRPVDEAVFLGALGAAATDLRPAGKGRFGEHLVDIVSYGSFISRGTAVVVIEIHGPRIVVKPAPSPPAPDSPAINPPNPGDAPPPSGTGGGGLA